MKLVFKGKAPKIRSRMPPPTKVIPSKKVYSRSKAKEDARKENP